MSHTSGPWFVADDEGRDAVLIGAKVATDWDKCDIWHTHGPSGNERTRADARLIAAAPDLLEALDLLAWVVVTHKATPDENCVSMVRAALTKAIGRGIDMTGHTKSLCPWCGSTVEPESNSDYKVDPEWAHRNPLRCPECGGVGGYEDFARGMRGKI